MADEFKPGKAKYGGERDNQGPIAKPQALLKKHNDKGSQEKINHVVLVANEKLQVACKFVTARFSSAGFWTALATVVMAVTTIIYTHYARKQWGEMAEQNRANVAIQRAFVYVDGFEITPVVDPSKPDQFTALLFSGRIKNSGSTQARNAHYHINFFAPNTPMPAGFAYPDRDEKGNVVQDEKGSEGFYPPNSTTSTMPVGVGMDTIRAIQEQHLTHLYLYGWIKYKDVFDPTKPHITKFCDEILFDQAPITPKSFLHPPRPSPCPEHNCTDDQCKGEK